MRALAPQLTLVEQAYEAILSAISDGRLPPRARLIQDELAETLGVSRQPVGQALLLLRKHGLVREAPRRGLMVAPLDLVFVRDLFDIRLALDGLAARHAATRNAALARDKGPAFIRKGKAAVKSGSIARMIAADIDFHFFLYGLSENALIADISEPHWHYLRRLMGEILLHAETPKDIWAQHEAIMRAVAQGKAAEAEKLAREHIAIAATILLRRMGGKSGETANPRAPSPDGRRTRPASP